MCYIIHFIKLMLSVLKTSKHPISLRRQNTQKVWRLSWASVSEWSVFILEWTKYIALVGSRQITCRSCARLMNKNNNNSLSLVRTFVSADPETQSEANANSSLTYLHRCTHHATLDPPVRSLSRPASAAAVQRAAHSQPSHHSVRLAVHRSPPSPCV